MLPQTAEWVAKAEGDWTTAYLAYRSRKTPNPDATCFHAQQCAEKYLKARLEEAAAPFPQTHNLLALLGLLLAVEPAWHVLDPVLRTLNVYAVTIRYPGVTATKADARGALANCRVVRDYVRSSLGLQ